MPKLRTHLWLTAVLICLTTLMALGPAPAHARRQGFGGRLCKQKGFHCRPIDLVRIRFTVQTERGEEERAAITLDSWESMFPDPAQMLLVMKLNRRNSPLKEGEVIAVPDQLEGAALYDFSPFPYKVEPLKSSSLARSYQAELARGAGEAGMVMLKRTEPVLIYDPKLLAWAAYDEDGRLVNWGPGVAGQDYCEDIQESCKTVTGEMRIIAKEGPAFRSTKFPLGCVGNGCAPMPYFMEFAPGYGFHASNDLPGRHASHGCVRLFPDDAQWLNQNFVEVGMKVVIKPY